MKESQSKSRRQLASKVLATIGIALLMLDTIKTFTSQHVFGRLNITHLQSEVSLGIPSILSRNKLDFIFIYSLSKIVSWFAFGKLKTNVEPTPLLLLKAHILPP